MNNQVTDVYRDIVASIGVADVQAVFKAFQSCAFCHQQARHLDTRPAPALGSDIVKMGIMNLAGFDETKSNDRKVRKIIQTLRNCGVCICTDVTGYWLSYDPVEIDDQARRFRSRAKQCNQTAGALQEVSHKLATGQLGRQQALDLGARGHDGTN